MFARATHGVVAAILSAVPAQICSALRLSFCNRLAASQFCQHLPSVCLKALYLHARSMPTLLPTNQHFC
eukprot:4452187-Amphidinium_carterae.1